MDFEELIGYQKAFKLATNIFEVSKSFPKGERYSLTNQIRRSSRSTCTNIAEAYRKRLYPKYYLSKSTDSDGENGETASWLDFAYACNYITDDTHQKFYNECVEIGKLLNNMMNHAEKFGSCKVLD